MPDTDVDVTTPRPARSPGYGRLAVLLVSLAGLAGAIWAIGTAGLAEVAHVAARLGIGGFLLFCAWSMGQFALLGAAWLSAAPGVGWRRWGLFAWARVVREAVADLLPFSALGGIVVSGRTITQAGVPAPVVYAALIADLATEMASQLILTLVGLALLVAQPSGAAGLGGLVTAGLGVMAAIMAVFYLAQRHGLAVIGRAASRMLPGSVAAIGEVDAMRARIFADPRRMAAAFAWNTAAWLASIGGVWLVLRLMGTPLSFPRTVSLEVLIFALRGVAFAIPGGIGVQEAGYALLGPALGLPLEATMAMALAKRARDLAIGVPALVIWQLSEARGMVRSTSG